MNYSIRHFDTTVLKFSYIDNGIKGQICKIFYINENCKHLLPIGLELTDEGVFSWLKKRTIPKNREYVDALLSKMGLSHANTIGIINLCKGLSLIDCYWIVEEDFTGLFSEYNLYENPFEKMLSLVAYTGYGSIKAKGFSSSPEFTTNGMLKKAWRHIKGKTLLYKGGTSGAVNTGNEPFSEFYAAQIAKAMEINHIFYDLSMWKGSLCSTCELFTNKEISFVQIYDFVKNDNLFKVSEFLKKLGENFYNDFVDMLIFDAIICNEDRHYGNFGLLVNNNTNKPISFAPLFDNGLSLFNYAMPEDFQTLEIYANTRISSYRISFLDVAKEFITKYQKDKIRKLINFTFTRHKNYNLPAYRLKSIEKFLQQRVIELLEIKNQ